MNHRISLIIGFLCLGALCLPAHPQPQQTPTKKPPEWKVMLRNDKRLEAKFEYKFTENGALDEALEILSKAAKVPLRLANPPKEGKIVVHAGATAKGLVYFNMWMIADHYFTDGKWEKDGNGYVLHGNPKNVWTPKDFADAAAKKKALDEANAIKAAGTKIRDEAIAFLQKDERLKVIVTRLSLRSDTKLQEVLDFLTKETKVPLRLADPPKEGKAIGDVGGLGPAYVMMATIAQSTVTDGKWEKDGDGYKLHGKPRRILTHEAEAKAIAAKKAGDEARAKKAAEIGKHFPLRVDPKLRPTFTLKENNPKLADLLKRLEDAADLQFTLADSLAKHEPVFGSVQFGLSPAWLVMELIANTDMENGKWVKTDKGYRLEGVSISSRPAPKNAKDAQVLWDSLADSKDPREPRRAINGLVAAPEVTLAFTKERLKPASGPDEKTFLDLRSRLLSKDNAVSEAARKELPKVKLNEGTLMWLKVDARKDARLKTIIADIEARRAKVFPQPSHSLPFHAVTVLERIGTAEARRQLEVLADGAYAATLTQEAKKALVQLQKTTPKK